jgi:furry protein family
MLKKVMAIPLDVDPDIPAHFGPGADPAFDKVLTSLGHIGSHKPTPVINTVMYWRKAKSDAAADTTTGGRSFTPTPANVSVGAVAAINASLSSSAMVAPPSRTMTTTPPPSLIRRQTEPMLNTGHMMEMNISMPTQSTALGQQILRDRQQRCAIYILCRTLIEVVKHTTADALTDDIASRIEDIVFRQLVKQDAEDFYRGAGARSSSNRNIFAELLGCFSNIR